MISRNKTMAITFGICIGLFAFTSSYNLIRNGINGTVSNNDVSGLANSGVEADYITNFWMKDMFIDLNGAVEGVIGAHEMNGIVKLNNGYLNRNQTIAPLEQELVNAAADSTLEFQRNLEEKGIDYVWFTLPLVVDKYDPQMPMGVDTEHGNANLDMITNAFYVRGINTVDLRESLHNQGMSTYDIFYKTDHHWTTKGGFWAYNQIVDYIEATCDVQVDETIRNINNYEIKRYEDSLLGSNGLRTGRFYAGVDDFDLLIPKFDTYIEKTGTKEGGTMLEMMYDMAPFSNKDIYTRYTYDKVLGKTLGYWHNPSAKADLKVMIVGDSMAKAVMPYLAMSFTDVAFGANNDKVAEVDNELLEEFQPDIVISLNYVWATSIECFDWGVE